MKIRPTHSLAAKSFGRFFVPCFWCLLVFAPAAFPQAAAGEISGEVERINYRQSVPDALREYRFENFDINQATGAFLLSTERGKIAVSRWISPKRTRSYPYERVYDTIAFGGKKAAVIPVVKDEGLGGDRDFLQWDTISLLSLLDVRVVLAYYDSAEKNPRRADQITDQKFDAAYVNARLKEVFDFDGTARQWNEREACELKIVLEKARLAYREISRRTKTYLRDEAALNELIAYAETPQKFIEFSRRKSRQAQAREFVTEQPKEALATDTKSKVTITNALFGTYFFTVDETRVETSAAAAAAAPSSSLPPSPRNTVYLIEAKHTSRAKLPSRNDIKDGLIKMMLYTNLRNVRVGAQPVAHRVQIRLTSSKLEGSVNSDLPEDALQKFCAANLINAAQANFLSTLFREARENKFTVILERGETAK